MSPKKKPIIDIRSPEDYQVTIFAPPGYEDLRDNLHQMVRAGFIHYIELEADPSILKNLDLDEMPDTPVVLVTPKGKEDEEGATEACVLSEIAESVIVHCEEGIVPLKGKNIAVPHSHKGAIPLKEVPPDEQTEED